MIGLGISAVLLSFMVHPILQTKQVEQGTEALAFLSQYRDELIRTLRDQASWDASVADATRNPEMACVRAKADCLPLRDVHQRMTLLKREPNGTDRVLNDTRDMAAGFNVKGQPCTEFSLTSPSEACPLRVSIFWQPQCGNLSAGQPCINPEVQVFVNFFISSMNPSLRAINQRSLGFRVFRNAKTEGLQATCVAKGGVFNDSGTADLADDVCVISPTVACPSGQSVIGFNSVGVPQCSNLSANLTCPPPGPPNYEPQFLQGMDASGNALCAPCP